MIKLRVYIRVGYAMVEAIVQMAMMNTFRIAEMYLVVQINLNVRITPVFLDIWYVPVSRIALMEAMSWIAVSEQFICHFVDLLAY